MGYAGRVNVTDSFRDIVCDACRLADVEQGFCHIVLIYFSRHRSSKHSAGVWHAPCDRVSVLYLEPLKPVNYYEPWDYDDQIFILGQLEMKIYEIIAEQNLENLELLSDSDALDDEN